MHDKALSDKNDKTERTALCVVSTCHYVRLLKYKTPKGL